MMRVSFLDTASCFHGMFTLSALVQPRTIITLVEYLSEGGMIDQNCLQGINRLAGAGYSIGLVRLARRADLS